MAVLLAIGILFGLLCTAKFLLLCICDVRMNDDFCELLAGWSLRDDKDGCSLTDLDD